MEQYVRVQGFMIATRGHGMASVESGTDTWSGRDQRQDAAKQVHGPAEIDLFCRTYRHRSRHSAAMWSAIASGPIPATRPVRHSRDRLTATRY
jgi:hypothetical protein